MSDKEAAKIWAAAKASQTKPALDKFTEERIKKLAALDRAMAVTKKWKKVCELVNNGLGSKVYKDGDSARVAHIN